MREKICEIPYINRIKDNILDVKRESLYSVYEDIKNSDCIILLGSGRSRHAAGIAGNQLAMTQNSKTVMSPEDVGFPGGNLYIAASKLERKYRKILALINSGSGESIDPRISASELANYIEETKSEKFKIDAVTSNPDSTIGKIAQKYGNVMELKGRVEGEANDYRKSGIMGDLFELGSVFILHSLVEALYENDKSKIDEFIESELPIIGQEIDENLENITPVVDVLERKCDAFGAAKGTGEKVIHMTLIRLYHIKKAMGDMVYVAGGVNTPRPRAGDIQISVSYSGNTNVVLKWCNAFKSLGGYQFSLVGNENSRLFKDSDFKILLKEKAEPGRPRRFYLRSAYVSSPIVMKLIERLKKRGLDLPENILRYYHQL